MLAPRRCDLERVNQRGTSKKSPRTDSTWLNSKPAFHLCPLNCIRTNNDVTEAFVSMPTHFQSGWRRTVLRSLCLLHRPTSWPLVWERRGGGTCLVCAVSAGAVCKLYFRSIIVRTGCGTKGTCQCTCCTPEYVLGEYHGDLRP